MFGRPIGMSLASAFIGTSMTSNPSSRTTAGVAPASGSAMMRLSGRSGISSAKRSAFCQSSASQRSKLSFMHSMGRGPSRISAAASPPRICGPKERRMMPKQPFLPARLNNNSPAVIEPAPPDPVTAMDMSQRSVLLIGWGLASRKGGIMPWKDAK